jgi:hypothetical protein
MLTTWVWPRTHFIVSTTRLQTFPAICRGSAAGLKAGGEAFVERHLGSDRQLTLLA